MKKELGDLLRENSSILVWVIALLGLVLRVWGSGFGLPQTYHIDELNYVPDAVRYVSTLDFQPSRWANPTLFKYLLAFEYEIVHLIARVIGRAEYMSSLEILLRNNPSIFYLLGRLSSGLLGAATIPVVYGIGAQAYGRKQGLAAAFLLAVSFLHARDSHYAVSDVPMAFFFSAAMLCYLLYMRRRASKYLYWAAGLTGLAIATKYTALILVAVCTATWALVKRSRGWRDLARMLWSRELLVTSVVMGLSFLVVCPYALLDYRGFLGSLRSHYGMIPPVVGYST
jgi:4-amino-4-deoxy-L-arabinose transferase-like glycosyltransferase